MKNHKLHNKPFRLQSDWLKYGSDLNYKNYSTVPKKWKKKKNLDCKWFTNRIQYFIDMSSKLGIGVKISIFLTPCLSIHSKGHGMSLIHWV